MASKASRPVSVSQSEACISLAKNPETSAPWSPPRSTPVSTERQMHRRRTLKSSMTPTASLPRSCWCSAILCTRALVAPPRENVSSVSVLRKKPTNTETNSSMPARMPAGHNAGDILAYAVRNAGGILHELKYNRARRKAPKHEDEPGRMQLFRVDIRMYLCSDK